MRPAPAHRFRAGSAARTRVRLLVVLAGAVLTLVVGAVPASAHDVLTGTSPSAGAQVDVTPGSVVLTFDQPAVAMGTQILVTGPAGQVQSGTPRLVDDTVTQDVEPGAPAGTYSVAWRVTSADGHPISGTFTFTSARAAAGTLPATSTAAVPTSEADGFGARTGAEVAALVVSGVVVAAGVVGLVRARRRRAGRSTEEP